MATWRLVDGSTGVIDRANHVVVRERDSWTIHTEAELLGILERLAGPKDRVMWLESGNTSVTFGLGGDFSFVVGTCKLEYGKSYLSGIRPEECYGDKIWFQVWQDDLFELDCQQLIPWSQALEIILWAFRHDDLPDWDQESGCRPPSRPPDRYDDEVPF